MKNKLYIAFTINALILLIFFSLSCNKEEYPVNITIQYTLDNKVVPGCEVIIGKGVDPKLDKEQCTLTTDYSGRVSHTFPYPAILKVIVKKALSGYESGTYGDSTYTDTSNVTHHVYKSIIYGSGNIRLIKNQTVNKTIYISVDNPAN
ncbi:MAG: hypothetical protein WC223_02255 [Bacteroidales bacterium]|jgi:hypothetical protein